jgi:hypothetical protein
MADQDYDFAQAVEKANAVAAADAESVKGVLLDLSAMSWGPNCKMVRLPLGPNGAPRFLALNTTPRSDEKGAK